MRLAKPSLARRGGRIGVSAWDIFGAVAFMVVGITVYMALLYAPTEIIQGEPYRIVYMHVPLITVSYIAFFLVFGSSVLYLWRRKPSFDIFARSAAEVGMLYLTLVIVSGGIWGQATWGTFWQWEPRLTFTFILWLIFLGYFMLRNASDNSERMARYCAVVGILGFADIPLIHMSVYLWRGLHPEPTIPPPEIGYTLLVGMAGFLMLFVYLMRLRYSIDRTRQRVEELRAIEGER
ncbi:MAG: heme exporter protein [Dehalococcoidia bacterium]|nr:heme exporter protein [Dehalococcoidia bacterium]